MRDLNGPQLLHVVTRKGKGYAPAEADPIKWHGPGPFDPASGTIFKEAPAARPIRRSSASGCATWPSATRADRRHHAGDARRLGTGGISKRFPERYFDVGIAEQHAVTFAAGLACEG
jgi:1-deoxy-D-xylulose-5-phosphate synthase